jgi:hypothetical protein
MELIPFIPGQIWLHSYPANLGGFRFDARMTVIRLASGTLVLHSPCDMTSALVQQISAIGPVGHLIAPGNYHTAHLLSAQKAFPEAKTWICPGVERKHLAIRYDGILRDTPPADWAGELDQIVVRGTRIMREVAMFHRASNTLLLVDLIENFTDATPHINAASRFLFKYVLGMWNVPRPAPEYQIGWKDRKAAKESLQRILSWGFTKIIIGHGDLIEVNADAVAREAWKSVLRA